MKARKDLYEDDNKYKILIMIEDDEKLNKAKKELSEIDLAKIELVNDESQMLSIMKNDHTYDILALSYGESEKESIELIKKIRQYNSSIFIVFLNDEYVDVLSMEKLARYNVQGYCKIKDNFDELKIWIYSGIRILEQTKMLKQLYVQTKNQAETIKKLNINLTNNYYETIDTLRKAVDSKDPYTRGHSDRVAYLSALIAETMGFDNEEIEKVRLGGQFHDIGKIGIKDSILIKPDRLTDEEYDEIKKHTVIGYELLKDNAIFKDILPGIRNHHEKWDGTGYPDGLSKNAIPLMARIICVADAFDAMMSKRSYRDKMDLAYTMDEIDRNKEMQFDPKVAEAFKLLIKNRYPEITSITGEY